MEIRTCEEYVLKQLFTAENKVEELEVDNSALHYELDKAVERITKLEKLIGTRTKYSSYEVGDGTKTLNFDGPWEKYDKEDFDLMVECMNKYQTEEKEDE